MRWALLGSLAVLLALLWGCQAGGLLVGDDDDTSEADDDTVPDDDDDDDADDDTDPGDDDTGAPTDADGDGFPVDQDCDDADAEVYPGVTTCDGVEVLECSDEGEWIAVEDCSPGECVDGQCDTLSCDGAEALDSHVGCEFFAFDMDQYEGFDDMQLAVVVVNVSADYTATVVVEERVGGAWTEDQTVDVAPLGEGILRLSNRAVAGTALLPGTAWRITSELPLTAWQVNALDASTYTADASLLLPTAGLDDHHVLAGHPHGDYGESTLVVVGIEDGVEVSVTPACDTAPGDGIPGGTAGAAMAPIPVDAGDAVQIVSAGNGLDLSGTLVESTGPVAVFAGHPCVNVPEDSGFCDHLEEQIPGTRRWGTQAFGARLAARANPPEITVWQIVAGTAGTTLEFEPAPGAQGVPGSSVVLGPREVTYIDVAGSAESPGDFAVEGTEPFLMAQFLSGNALAGEGDPCMALATPVQRWLDHYVVYADPHMSENHLTITRPLGSLVEVDGTDVESWPTGVDTLDLDGIHEVVRIAVTPGPHAVTGAAPFTLTVGGWSDYVSLCYPASF